MNTNSQDNQQQHQQIEDTNQDIKKNEDDEEIASSTTSTTTTSTTTTTTMSINKDESKPTTTTYTATPNDQQQGGSDGTTTITDVQQQQQVGTSGGGGGDNNSFIDIDKTLKKVKDKKQKEREDRLAEMMGHYHKKYSSPTLDSANGQDQANGGTNQDEYGSLLEQEMTEEELLARQQRQHQRNQRKKDMLAEQMKKYHDQYQNLISDVNNILSSPSSLSGSNSSSAVVSPSQSPFTSSPNFLSSPVSLSSLQQHHEQLSTPQKSSPSLSSSSLPTSPSTEFKSIPIVSLKHQQQQQKDPSSSDLKEQEEKEEQEKEQLKEKQRLQDDEKEIEKRNQQQQQSQQPSNINDPSHILYFEHQDIPYLSNVGFATLKSIETDAIRCAESVVSLTRNLNYSLLLMSRMSVELFNTFKMSNEMTCLSVHDSINSVNGLINKCTELNDQTKILVQLQLKIKLIRECVDKFDTIFNLHPRAASADRD
ncbi:hypothetical protein DFA_08108 [Cavenderia fasciculata]|uniref:BLOC-1-related complex subunit 6 C-terminal helix domain-containing protein n=1 Tax=Cavenderia fasciculata TaxID=261658 RepID=F4Q567_CACFS|nr:uncharacterized protein DFA_08108 [Cavenderia fasciculata]EGG17126.1 hypothetical protein DFA_08108 [Cavenderia fasciculata]|eukprot:XP_004355610.1 hypothetical protein DFA_08108 [Cavenderia fasciculata]